MTTPITSEELKILTLYADSRGVKWRDSLMTDWARGADVAIGDALMAGGGSILRRLRNTRGPSWLADYHLV